MAEQTDSIVQNVITHLTAVLSKETSFDSLILQRADTKLSLDNSLLIEDAANGDKILQSLLPLLITVLRTPLDGVDYGLVVSLLSTVLSHKSYAEVVQFISQNDLIEGLQSGVSHLQIACINQITKANPPDILANTPVILVLVKLIASRQVESEVVYAVQKALSLLASFGHLVRRRLFSGDSLEILTSSLFNGDSILQARLMNLITDVLPFDKAPNQYIPTELIAFPPEGISHDDDLLLVLNKIQFYRDIISNPHPSTLITSISPQIEAVAVLYSKLENDPVMESFLTNETLAFFGVLSSTYMAVFRELDVKYKLTHTLESSQLNFNNAATNMFLSLLSPRYVYEFLSDTIRLIPLRAHTVRVLRNLVKHEPSFQLLVSGSCALADQTKIVELPYLELMALLVPITATTWGVNGLVRWPKVVDAILFKEDVRDKDSVSYRREVFDNLVKSPSQSLGVWNEPIRTKYRELVHGVVHREAHAAVADESAS
ncbi:Hsm3p [Sugiyamaella lignohabitans]|uniref:DNA mismatch repair protein HSM3 n=1 Tax=Sugiyamaella lignohabitans TaxID=796027 RepID=A0A167CAZ7_9ASCO|nr:Hsm3p [Sugiyamaella lignohabitans]ANB11449.1 Hsm3p [Sugiyamaella lignohabitans]